MKQYLKNLFNSGSREADTKEFITIGSWIMLVVIVVLNAFGKMIDWHLIYIFASLAGGSSILTVLQGFIKKNGDA